MTTNAADREQVRVWRGCLVPPIVATVRTKVGEYRAQKLGWKIIGWGGGVLGISKLGENSEKSDIDYAQLRGFRCVLITRSAHTPGQPPFASAQVLRDFETGGVRALHQCWVVKKSTSDLRS